MILKVCVQIDQTNLQTKLQITSKLIKPTFKIDQTNLQTKLQIT